MVPGEIRTGAVSLAKRPGEEKMSDIMTKYIDRSLLQKMLAKMNLIEVTGIAECAPAAAGC